MLTDSFEGFAHSLRILLEAVFNSVKLLVVDSHEAAGNIEQGLTNALNACHSLYDSARADKRVSFDWYGTAETATILSIRNARHHNHANRIRGLYTYHLQQPLPDVAKDYLIVDCPQTADGGDTFDVPISWYDLNELLHLPQKTTRLSPDVAQSIYKYLNGDVLNGLSKEYNVDSRSVFLNVTPLLVNCAIRFVPAIKSFITPRSLEARTFLTLFENVLPGDTNNYTVAKISICLPS